MWARTTRDTAPMTLNQKIRDLGEEVAGQDGRLGDEGGDERGVAADLLEIEGDEEDPEDRPVEQGPEDIDGLDQGAEMVGELGEADGVEPPEDRGRFRDAEIVPLRGVLAGRSACRYR